MTLRELREKVQLAQADEADQLGIERYKAYTHRNTILICHKLMSEEVDRWIAEHGLARIEVTNAKGRIEGLKEDYRYNLKLAQSYSIELLQKDEHIKELEAAKK